MTIHIESPLAIQQLDSDPASPYAQQAWVLKSSSGPGGHASTKGMPMGLLMALTYAVTSTTTGGTTTYQFSYRTKEGTTERVTIS